MVLFLSAKVLKKYKQIFIFLAGISEGWVENFITP